MKKVILLVFMFLFSLSFVSAERFTTGAGTYGDGRITILNVQHDSYKLNDDITLYFSVLNYTGEILNSSDIGCQLYVYDTTGNYELEGVMSYDLGTEEFYYPNFTVTRLGTYPYRAYCNNTNEYGVLETSFISTPTGNPLSTSVSVILIFQLIVLVSIIILGFFFGMASRTPIVKLFSLSLALLLTVFTIGYSLNLTQKTIGEFDTIVSIFQPVYITSIVLLGGWGIGIILYLIVYSFKLFYKSRGYLD